MDDLARGFHNRDGWYFRRDSDDGNVRIWKVRWVEAVRLCTSHCPPFRHFTQQQDGVQCDVVDADGKYRYMWVPQLDAGPHIIPENEWASIVASVSRGGETSASWQFVRDFHNPPAAALAPHPEEEAPVCPIHGTMVADDEMGRSWHCAACESLYPVLESRPTLCTQACGCVLGMHGRRLSSCALHASAAPHPARTEAE